MRELPPEPKRRTTPKYSCIVIGCNSEFDSNEEYTLHLLEHIAMVVTLRNKI